MIFVQLTPSPRKKAHHRPLSYHRLGSIGGVGGDIAGDLDAVDAVAAEKGLSPPPCRITASAVVLAAIVVMQLHRCHAKRSSTYPLGTPSTWLWWLWWGFIMQLTPFPRKEALEPPHACACVRMCVYKRARAFFSNLGVRAGRPLGTLPANEAL